MSSNLIEPADSLPKLVSELLRYLSDWPEFDDWERRLARLSAAPSPEGLREAAEEMVAAWRDAETDLTTSRMDIAAKRLWAALGTKPDYIPVPVVTEPAAMTPQDPLRREPR